MSTQDVTVTEEETVATDKTANDDATFVTDRDESKESTPSAQDKTESLPRKWMVALTEEQKADKELIAALSEFERGIPDLVPAYAELKKKMSATPTPPNEEATDEEKAAWRAALGVPEKPEDYKLEDVKLPEGIGIDESLQGDFLALANNIDLTDKQVNAIRSWYLPAVANQVVAAQRVVKVTQDEAKKSFRERHGENAAAAQTYMERSMRTFFKPEAVDLIRKTGIGNHPDFIDALVEIGKKMGDDTIVDPERGEPASVNPIGKRTFAEMANTVYPERK